MSYRCCRNVRKLAGEHARDWLVWVLLDHIPYTSPSSLSLMSPPASSIANRVRPTIVKEQKRSDLPIVGITLLGGTNDVYHNMNLSGTIIVRACNKPTMVLTNSSS